MKRSRFLALLLAMVLLLSACSQPAQKPKEETPTTEAPVVEENKENEEDVAIEQKKELTPAYSVADLQTVDAEGNRITYGRNAIGKNAMASSSKYEVSQVGAEILKKGGNAVDAAVAMGFALGVCEPFTNGIGGGGLATIHTSEGESIFIDFREKAPAAAELSLYVDEKGEPNGNTMTGGLASGIPGDVAGLLYMLENYGTMSRDEVLEPAIRIAEEGFTVSQYAANAIMDAYDKAMKFPEMQKVYWDENSLPYESGRVINNPDMAKVLKKIAAEGTDGFYKGEVAQAIIDTLSKYDGVMTLEDLANYKVTVSEPVKGDYRGYTIISSPPPSSGGTHLIEILNILENFDISSLEINSPEYIHLFTEAFKLSFADRAKYMADEAFVDVPLIGLTSQEYADKRAKLIKPDSTIEEATYDDPTLFEHTDTSHFSIADKEGNMVAITKTINYYFGSGVMVDGYGFMMNNEMDDFSTDPESVNKIEPGKKPLSSMSPTIILDSEGNPFMVTGTPGGARIFSSIAQVVSRVVDHKMPIDDAISVPKIWNNGPKNNLQYEEPLKGYEAYAITEDTLKKLQEMGHGEGKTAASGAIQTIIYRPDGTLFGTADPRQDGRAVGF